MRRLIALVGLVTLSACNASAVDACAGVSGTCVSLLVKGSGAITEVDALSISINGSPRQSSQFAGGKAERLPVAVALSIGSLTTSTLSIDVQGELQNVVEGEGSTTAVLSTNQHESFVVVLKGEVAGDMAIDMSPKDMLGGDDLSTLDGPRANDMAGAGPDMAKVHDLLPVDLGSGWTLSAEGNSNITYQSVYGSSPTGDVFVGGYSDGNSNYIHFSPSGATPGAAGAGAITSVWALDDGTTAWFATADGSIYRWLSSSGTASTEITGLTLPRSIWASSSGTVLCLDGEAPSLYSRATNGTWSTASTGTSNTVNSALWGTAATNLYMLGWIQSASVTPVIDHRGTGSSFTAQTLPQAAAGRPYAIWGSSSTDIYVVGQGGMILHSSDGSSWTLQTSNTTNDLNGVFGSSPTNIIAVGAAGTLLHSTGTGTWSTVTVPTSHDLYGVWVANSGQVWAVGTNGTIMYGAP